MNMVDSLSATASLLSLPLEVLTQIFDYLGADGPESARACLYVCKQLYEVALPASVHTYYLYKGPRSRNREGKQRSILKFIDYITVIKPFLAKHVKCVLFGNYTTDDTTEAEYEPLLEEERDRYHCMIVRTFPWDKLHGDDKWLCYWFFLKFRRALDLGSEEAALCLLLVACHRLEDFCFGYTCGGAFLLGMFVQIAAIRLQRLIDYSAEVHCRLPLRNLRSVYQESDDLANEIFPFPDHQVMPFFGLPLVTRYECVLVDANKTFGADVEVTKVPDRSSSIQNICMRGVRITRERLNDMTIACKSLRSFEYSSVPRDQWDGWELMPREVLHVLLPHKDTLEHLHLNQSDDFFRSEWESRPAMHVLGCELSELGALKTLVAGMQCLTGYLDATRPQDMPFLLPSQKIDSPPLTSCLPTSLRYLEILHCTACILGPVQALLNSLAEPEPRLANLVHVRLLFIAELTRCEDVILHCPERVKVKLEILYQTKRHRDFDVNPALKNGMVMFTRLYDRTGRTRQEWLEKRGTDKGVIEEDSKYA